MAHRLPPCGAVLGDFNLVGPVLLRGFRDVGPRWPTHRMGRVVPLRIDRCLVRGLACEGARVLPRRGSDHRPISVHLVPEPGAEVPHLGADVDVDFRFYEPRDVIAALTSTGFTLQAQLERRAYPAEVDTRRAYLLAARPA